MQKKLILGLVFSLVQHWFLLRRLYAEQKSKNHLENSNQLLNC